MTIPIDDQDAMEYVDFLIRNYAMDDGPMTPDAEVVRAKLQHLIAAAYPRVVATSQPPPPKAQVVVQPSAASPPPSPEGISDAMVQAAMRAHDQAFADLSDFLCKENDHIAMQRAIAAALATIAATESVVCPGCDGLGREPDECDGRMVERSCRDCNGTGKVPVAPEIVEIHAETLLDVVRRAEAHGATLACALVRAFVEKATA